MKYSAGFCILPGILHYPIQHPEFFDTVLSMPENF